MTRRRSGASGRIRPDRRRSLLFLCLAAVSFVAACGGTSMPTAAPSVGGPEATDPGATDTPTPEPPTPEPASAPPDTPEPSADPSASPSTGPGASAACSGTDDNREFFASIAEAVTWPVYCAVLPSGWFVETGTYRLAGGGWLEIAYRGPGGARLELREGQSCAEPPCVPAGEGVGTADFGDLTGVLSHLDDGRSAVIVDIDDPDAYVAIGSGMDDDSLVAIAADLARVGD